MLPYAAFLALLALVDAGCVFPPDPLMDCDQLHKRFIESWMVEREKQAERCPPGTKWDGETRLRYSADLASGALDYVERMAPLVGMGMQNMVTGDVGIAQQSKDFSQVSEALVLIGGAYGDAIETLNSLNEEYLLAAGILGWPPTGEKQIDCMPNATNPNQQPDCMQYVKFITDVTTHVGCAVGRIPLNMMPNPNTDMNLMVCRLGEGRTEQEVMTHCVPHSYCHLEPVTQCTAPCGGTGTQVWKAMPPSCNLPLPETRPCNLHPCTCDYTEWWPITPCSEPCVGVTSRGWRQEARARRPNIPDTCTDITRVRNCSNLPCDKLETISPNHVIPHIMANPLSAPVVLSPGPARGSLPGIFLTLPPEVPMAAFGVHLLGLPGMAPAVGPAIAQADAARDPAAGSYGYLTPLIRLPNVLASPSKSEFENATAFGACIPAGSPPSVMMLCDIATWAAFVSAIQVRAVFHCDARYCDNAVEKTRSVAGGSGGGSGSGRDKKPEGAQMVVEIACPVGAQCCKGGLQALTCNDAPVAECACNGVRVECPRCTYSVPGALIPGISKTALTSTSLVLWILLAVALCCLCCLAAALSLLLWGRRRRAARLDECEAYDDRLDGSAVMMDMFPTAASSSLLFTPNGPAGTAGTVPPGVNPVAERAAQAAAAAAATVLGGSAGPVRWEVDSLGRSRESVTVGEGMHYVHPRSVAYFA